MGPVAWFSRSWGGNASGDGLCRHVAQGGHAINFMGAHMRKPVRSLALLSTAALALGLTLTGGAASAAPTPEVIAKHIAGPLSLAVADDGSVYVTGDNSGTLYHVVPGQAPEVIYQSSVKGAEVGAVSVNGDVVTFAITIFGKSEKVYQIAAGGAPHVIANVGKYEKDKNPDAKTAYGFKSISKACAAQLPKQVGPAQYTGIVDSHPYSSETTDAGVYVGDAAGNDILLISPTGKISTVAVLPPTPVKVTKKKATASHLPACTIGLTYKFEPVPTDVELGPNGRLYVSSLPGGPEDGSTGPQGRVYKVNPKNGAVKMVADGFLSTVDLAVADNGDVYVAQLFAGQISRIPAGTSKVKPFLAVSMPAAVEWTPDYLYATTDALKGSPKKPGGKVVRIAWQ